MEKEIAKLSGHYIVCGIGRVGTNVAHELLKTRRKFVVVETDRGTTRRRRRTGSQYPYKMPSSLQCLRQADYVLGDAARYGDVVW